MDNTIYFINTQNYAIINDNYPLIFLNVWQKRAKLSLLSQFCY